jgi:hypothetical protein
MNEFRLKQSIPMITLHLSPHLSCWIELASVSHNGRGRWHGQNPDQGFHAPRLPSQAWQGHQCIPLEESNQDKAIKALKTNIPNNDIIKIPTFLRQHTFQFNHVTTP